MQFTFAGRGVAFDYTVTDNMVTITRDRNDFATVTIRMDSIALEEDETFQLKLVANPQPSKIFCLDTLDLVIEDGSGIIMSDQKQYVQTIGVILGGLRGHRPPHFSTLIIRLLYNSWHL